MIRNQIRTSNLNQSFNNHFYKTYKKFDWTNYIDLNDDLKYLKTENEAILHYINCGIKEKRQTYVTDFNKFFRSKGFIHCFISDYLNDNS